MHTSTPVGGPSGAGMSARTSSFGGRARSKDELMNDFRNLISEGEALLRSTASLSGDAFAQAREQFRETLAQAKTRVSDTSRAAIDRGRRAASATDGYVRSNPWQAIGVAAALGFVIGALLVRR
jgi:ElaB/YqjD/DUF883 family membrane-anchored ribosome-binding protein